MSRQTVAHLAVADLLEHPANIRDDLGPIDDLAHSIREHGILQPLTVTEGPEGKWLLIAGHRRLAAARHAGLPRVPVVIRHDVTEEADQLVLMLVENCQRRDLNPVEKAEAFGALRNRGMSLSEIGKRVGCSVQNVSYYMTFLDLPEDERAAVRSGAYTARDAAALVRQRREAERKREPNKGAIGRPKGRKTTPWFGDKHPLAKTVRALCNHVGVPKVGTIGCGPCWEKAIREDAEVRQAPVAEYDEAAVLRAISGEWDAAATPSDKAEVCRRWVASGKPLADLERFAGWAPSRYFRLYAEGAAS